MLVTIWGGGENESYFATSLVIPSFLKSESADSVEVPIDDYQQIDELTSRGYLGVRLTVVDDTDKFMLVMMLQEPDSMEVFKHWS